MGIFDSIKQDAKKAGQSKAKFVYLRDGDSKRLRFLQDMEDGYELPWHDSFTEGINVPCQETFGLDCPYCSEEGLRTKNMYGWSVWDYDAQEVRVFLFAVNQFTPIPALASMYESYGTITDRDYVIKQTGKGTNKSITVVPQDKQKFRNQKAKPFSEQTMYKLIQKAWPDPNGPEDDEEETPKAKKKPTAKSKSKKPARNLAKATTDDLWEILEEGTEEFFSEIAIDLKPAQLYKMCIEKDIEAEQRKPAKYYINLLEEYNEAQDDWTEDDEDDDFDNDWDDEAEDDEWEDEEE